MQEALGAPESSDIEGSFEDIKCILLIEQSGFNYFMYSSGILIDNFIALPFVRSK